MAPIHQCLRPDFTPTTRPQDQRPCSPLSQQMEPHLTLQDQLLARFRGHSGRRSPVPPAPAPYRLWGDLHSRRRAAQPGPQRPAAATGPPYLLRRPQLSAAGPAPPGTGPAPTAVPPTDGRDTASAAASAHAGVHRRPPLPLSPAAGRRRSVTLRPGLRGRSGLTFRHVLVDSALHLREAPLEVVAARRAAASSGSCNRARRQAGPAPSRHRPSARPPARSRTALTRHGAGGTRPAERGRPRRSERSAPAAAAAAAAPAAAGEGIFPLFKMAPNARRPAG